MERIGGLEVVGFGLGNGVGFSSRNWGLGVASFWSLKMALQKRLFWSLIRQVKIV